MRKWFYYFALVLCLCRMPGCSAQTKQGTVLSGTVRVSLSSLSDITDVDLVLDGSYTLGDSGTAYPRGTSLHVSNQNGSLYLLENGHRQSMGTQMKLRRHDTAGENGIRIAQARYPNNLYPGDLEIRVSGSSLQLIVHVYIEDYLVGVLPFEMDDGFPIEALKAQAVAARTYALKMISMQSSVYDVVDTTNDQVYNGMPVGMKKCEEAVRATAGCIGLINGEYMATFYTASNGGQTESVKNAWGSNTYKYLIVKDDPYDLRNPQSIARSVSLYKDGTTSVPALTELLRNEAAVALNRDSVTISAITDVRLSSPKYGQDSKVFKTVEVDLEIKGAGSVTLKLDYFSQVEGICALSINSLQNETLAVTQTVGGFKLTARRFGHGIGMSQRGAQQMASEGFLYNQILEFYYPGLSETKFTFERTLLSSLDGTGAEDTNGYIDAKSATVSLNNPLDVLNLRKAGSMDAAILATIPHGTRVTVLEQSGGWSRIQHGTLSGYVKDEYLKTEDTTAAETRHTGESGTTIVSLADETQILNLRASPTTAASVLSYLRSGQVLTVLERYSKWTQVQYGSIIGYVMNDYIRDPEESGTEPPADNPAEEPQADQIAVVLPSTGLNLRLSASIRSAVIMVLPQGTIVNLTGAARNGMIPVSIGNINGFVAQEYVYVTVLQSSEPTPEPTPDASPKPFRLYASVNADNGLILRSGPAQQADAICLLPKGTQVLITGEAESGFFPVLTDSQAGYVSEKYLTFLTDAEVSLESVALVTETPEMPSVTPSPVPPASRVLSGEGAYVNAAGGLNLRSEPNSSSKVLAVIGNQVRVVVLGEQENGFYPVRIGTMTGYLSASYLVFGGNERDGQISVTATPAPSITPTVATAPVPAEGVRMIVESANGLNLRAKPNKSSEVLYVLPYGMVLTVIGNAEGDFLHVRWNNYEGYVSSAFVSPLDAE